jgi:2-polyprenyl-3-methyl-5-hydroxy-6-metoxy-1,4-benzoquinol methylase
MTSDLDSIYTREWVETDFADLRPEFNLVADGIGRTFGLAPNSKRSGRPCVTDVGCGPGMLIERLHDRWHVCVRGIEGSSHCIAYADRSIRDLITQIDITDATEADIRTQDLVVCTEVAEHLEAEYAPHLVALLASANCPIVFTAAPPGQDGNHHVNCQPREYWLELFAAHGVLHDVGRTCKLQSRWVDLRRLSHLSRNLMVLA